MEIIKTLSHWRTLRQTLTNDIGFAPTMGNIHQGHVSLFDTAKKNHALVVSSLFVNPTQFNNKTDFAQYPRTLDSDIVAMANAGVDYCLLPSSDEIYADKQCFFVHESSSSHIMEGAHRPGHFDGMLTVVLKLLNLVKPHSAYFGEKDYQQLTLIKRLVDAFFIETRVIGCKTIREKSGLALSSRNNRLNATQKKLADEFAAIFHNGLDNQAIKQQLLTKNIEVDYIEEHDGRRFAAVTIDGIRLIDNYAITFFDTPPV